MFSLILRRENARTLAAVPSSPPAHVGRTSVDRQLPEPRPIGPRAAPTSPSGAPRTPKYSACALILVPSSETCPETAQLTVVQQCL
ncbi:predicted protein [Verticillium alfalfae VaMs.102]|uniref:Predicted protein n=1 Tax=Verticillium alfalfae (strain VaMs.102 / ATCC MYA-4576 / FGSC 10136) TaxID=526221 RepID=C9SWH1_VERA1|nr:predicted protein [Verticillium alfalfae VaMs.102]EEY23136.1 predicted protein [Verticillium alfalfae VaMs.102]